MQKYILFKCLLLWKGRGVCVWEGGLKMFALLSTIYNHWILTKSTILLLVGHCLECWCARLAPCTLIYNLQPLDFGKIYNINYKLAKSTSTINLFTTHLKPNHQLILTEYTIYKKEDPPLLSRHF